MAKKNNTVTTTQTLSIWGAKVNKKFYHSDKVDRGSLDILSTSPSGKTIHTYVNYVWFSPSMELEEGDVINGQAHLYTDSYEKDGEKRYTLGICIDDCEVI